MRPYLFFMEDFFETKKKYILVIFKKKTTKSKEQTGNYVIFATDSNLRYEKLNELSKKKRTRHISYSSKQ